MKHFPNAEETERERSILEYLHQKLITARVSEIIASQKENLTFSYIKGIRIFNLLVELDGLEPPLNEVGARLKRRIIARCEDRQKEIQAALISYPRAWKPRPYPIADKAGSIVKILSDALGIVVDWELVKKDLGFIAEVWTPDAMIPFRDATTKNMALEEPTLWLGAFESEEERSKYIATELARDESPDWIEAPITDFDFSSCTEDTTPEDDPISLKFHERTWMGPPRGPEDLVWNQAPNARRAAITFLIRYYRFGGRKAAYRLLHPMGHRIRFRYDNDAFYFERLPSIMSRLWPETLDQIPNLIAFTNAVSRFLGSGRAEVDLFLAAFPLDRRRYYVDMYPE